LSSDLETRVERVVRVLDKRKAEDIEVINLEDIDYIAKGVVIATSMGGKQRSS